ncbi:MAG TPA: PRC-barrel domain-containing protein [Oculatellaceae cyanobacterium]|jgi:uncharacterized protein YrrD
MLKGNDIIGMPIVAHDTGEQIKVVKDLIFDHNSKLLGFLVAEKSLFKDTQVLPLHSVKVIGRDVIIATSETAIASASRLPEIQQALEPNIVMGGTKIVTEEGYDLGTIIDLYFDKQTALIEGYEVRGGLFADPQYQISFVPAPHNLKIGDDVAFVPRDIAEMMTERITLINTPTTSYSDNLSSVKSNETISLNNNTENIITSKGSFIVSENQPLPPVAEVYTTDGSTNLEAKKGLLETATTNGDQLHATEENSNEQSQTAITLYRVEQTAGLRVRCSIKTQEGIYVAALGQIVTEKVIARATMYQQERALIDAVCTTSSSSHSPEEVTSIQLYGGKVTKKTRGNIREQLSSLINHFQQQGIDQEVKLIKKAVGRRVNRVILDKNDNLILDVGQLITYQAIEQARRANVLDILLDSVDHKNQKFLKGDRLRTKIY